MQTGGVKAGKRSTGGKGGWGGGVLALVAQGAGEAGQALAVACDVMARPGAVHALRARLAAAVPVEARGADCKQCRRGRKGERREGGGGNQSARQEVYNNETGQDECDQGSGEGKKEWRPEDIKEKKQEETARGGREQESQTLL